MVARMTIYPVVVEQMEEKYSVCLAYPTEGGLLGVFYICETEANANRGIQILVNKGQDPNWLSLVGPDGRLMSFSWEDQEVSETSQKKAIAQAKTEALVAEMAIMDL